MRVLLAVLFLCPLAIAAPVPKETAKPNVEVKLEGDTFILKVKILNNGQEAFELPYKVTPWEHIRMDLHGAKGKHVKYHTFGEDIKNAKPGKLTIPAGGTEVLTFHICHSVPDVSPNGEPFTVFVKLRCGDKTVESKLLVLRDE